MYAFIDQPVTALNRGGRLLVWAMRKWVGAATAGRCPCSEVGSAFNKNGLMAGFPHFHMLMALLNRNASEKLCFGPPEHHRVTEHEAVVLALVRVARDDEAFDAVRETLKLIVCDGAVAPLHIAFAALGEAMVEVGLRPLPPMFDTRHASFPNE